MHFFVLDRTSVAMAKAGVFRKKSNYCGKTFSVHEPSSFRWVQHIDWPPSWQQDISQGLLVGDGRLSSWVASLRWVTFTEKCDLIQHMAKQKSSRSRVPLIIPDDFLTSVNTYSPLAAIVNKSY